jgi:hypothetical protein
MPAVTQSAAPQNLMFPEEEFRAKQPDAASALSLRAPAAQRISQA